MAIYSVEGKLGTGKTKFCVWKAQEALRAGRRVATNLNLVVEKLTPEKPRTYIRLPDKPSTFDFHSIGHGNPESYDEERNGVLILDELGTWLNTRSFQDKDRAGVIDWLIHARKFGWDVYLIVQDAAMIDKQVRESLIEYQARCLRLDKVRIPIVGKLLGSIFGGRVGYLPRMHLVTARVGFGANAVVAERWTYRGDDLHAAYDTRQIFEANYSHGAHCILPPPPPKLPLSLFGKVREQIIRWSRAPDVRRALNLKPKLPVVLAAMEFPPDERIAALRLHIEKIQNSAFVLSCP